jgi:hypothetical protein
MDERVGTAQRTAVHDLLSTALAGGYLELAEYEERAAAVDAARVVGDLVAQVADLPAPLRWDPGQPAPAPPREQGDDVRVSNRAAFVLGIASIPMAICLGAGLIFGVAAIIMSLPGGRAASGWGLALTARVLGLIGIVLSLGFLAILVISNVTD